MNHSTSNEEYLVACVEDCNALRSVGEARPLELARHVLVLHGIMKRIEGSKPPIDGHVDLENDLAVFLKQRKLQCASLVRSRALVGRERRDFERYLERGEITLQLPEEELPHAETVDVNVDSFEICASLAARDFVRSQLNHRAEFASKIQIQLYGCAEDSQVAALVRAIFPARYSSRCKGQGARKEGDEPVRVGEEEPPQPQREEDEEDDGGGSDTCSEDENREAVTPPGTCIAYPRVAGYSRSAASYGLVDVDLHLANWSQSIDVATRNGLLPTEAVQKYLYLCEGAVKFNGALDFDPDVVRKALPHVEAVELRSETAKQVRTTICTELNAKRRKK